jgi:RNA polymerase-binding transcription factor DksA
VLNRRDVIQLAAAIGERRDALREEIRREVARGREESYAELAGATHDRGEEALADLVVDLGNAEVARDLEELRGLEAALRRIADGGFGLCADCGAEIAPERLRAQPAAARCVECQGRRERTYQPK